jgi:hypothetical protein
MSGIMNMLLGARTAIAAAVDEFFNRVTLLLPGDGTNGAQNNTFLDSSTNNFTITRNGNTTQGTFSPFSQTGWSNYFGGSTDYVAFTSIAAYGVGTGNFSVQLFVNFNSTSGNQRMFCVGASGTDGINIQFAGGSTQLQIDIANTRIITHTWTPVVGTWYQIDVVRAGTSTNQTTLYINGSSVATGTSSGSVGQNAANIGGLSWNSAFTVNGYVSNVRFSNTARSISAVTTNYSSDANTLLLTAQSNRFLDNSSSGNTFTTGGTPSVQPFSPFAPTIPYSAATVGGSGYFDGTGDMLETPSITIGTNNFCFECWLYPTVAQGATTGIFTADTNGGLQLSYFGNPTTGLGIARKGVDWDVFNSNGTQPIVGQWNHVAYVRSGTGSNQTSIFLNGTRIANGTSSSNYAASLYEISTTNAGGTLFVGYISGARLTNGSTPYDATQSTITIPTAPLTTSASNTTLLLNFTNAGITDATAKNDLETVGNAQISTAQSKFGGSSIAFDGSGDYLDVPSIINAQFGTGDFTIEGWLYINSLAAAQCLIEFRAASGASYGQIYITTGGVLRYYLPTDVGTSNTFSTGTWTHFAITRSSGTLNMYINGTRGYSASYTSAMDASRLRIGADVSGGSGINGYIDDLRITKGFARYTGSTLTVPTVAFPLQ